MILAVMPFARGISQARLEQHQAAGGLHCLLHTCGTHQSCYCSYRPLPLKLNGSQFCHLQGCALQMTQHMTTCSREQMNHLRRTLLMRVPITLRSTDLMCLRFSPW